MKDHSPLFAPNKAIILAAGHGKRLRPYTDLTPKPLLTVNGLPMLETIFMAVQAAGISEVCLVVHHLADQIQDFAGNGQRWQLKISYVHQKAPLGTADAVRSAADFITEPCYILAADYALPINFLTDLRDAYIAQSCPLFASLKELSPEELAQKSSVRFDENGRIIEIVEKPDPDQTPSSTAAALFLIVPPEIRPYLTNLTPSIRGEFELTDVLNQMIRDNYPMSGLLQPQPEEWKIPIKDLNHPSLRAKIEKTNS